jgi:4-hydroxybutyryl-CoA dehydratase / vinylacetyl-CoA-Delta-isomerase
MLTGQQYLDSLNDGRKIYLRGELVDNVATHPAFRPTIEDAAAGYDRYFQPGEDATAPYYAVSRSVEDLRELEEVQLTWDMLSTSTATGINALMTAASRMRGDLPEYADRAMKWLEDAKKRDIRCVQTITDAKGDRSLSAGKQDDPDAYVRIVERRSDGVVIRGAKLHITSAAVAHELLVMPTKRMKPGEEDYAITCAVPVNAPGVKIVNVSYAPPAEHDWREYPASALIGTTEGFVIFDDVFVPTERVFLDGQTEHSADFAHSLGLWERLGSLGHYVELADTIVGLAQLISEANGTTKIPHIKEKISGLIVYATMLRASLEAAISGAMFTPEGWATPNELYTNAAKFYAASEYANVIRDLHDIGGGSTLTAPALADLENPETGSLVAKYMTAMPGVSAEQRIRLFHAIRDFTADGVGAWQLVTMLQAGGGLYAQRVVATKHYDMEHARTLGFKVAGITAP